MLEALGLAHLRLEFGPDLLEQLVEASRIAWGDAPHAAVRVHGHCVRRDSATTSPGR